MEVLIFTSVSFFFLDNVYLPGYLLISILSSASLRVSVRGKCENQGD